MTEHGGDFLLMHVRPYYLRTNPSVDAELSMKTFISSYTSLLRLSAYVSTSTQKWSLQSQGATRSRILESRYPPERSSGRICSSVQTGRAA